jgi:hypothetical protein
MARTLTWDPWQDLETIRNTLNRAFAGGGAPGTATASRRWCDRP